MKLRIVGTLALLFLVGCATYKQLQPDPVLSPAEQGYIELKKKEKDFELKQGKRYFISFPAPADNHFYLVLELPKKKQIRELFTASLIKKKQVGKLLTDESEKPDSLSVFPIDKQSPAFFWLIDSVFQDLVLKVRYRYVPQWRYKFENKHEAYKKVLEDNRMDRTTYQGIRAGFHKQGFQYGVTRDSLEKTFANLNEVHKKLLEIESIFPENILNSKDEAYQNFVKLKKEMDDEITFQSDYLATLRFLQDKFDTRNDPAAFLKKVPAFTAFFRKDPVSPDHILVACRAALEDGLAGMVPFYRKRLSGKDDASPIDAKTYLLDELKYVDDLYDASTIRIPDEHKALNRFIAEFNTRSTDLTTIKEELGKIDARVKDPSRLPGDDFFEGILGEIKLLKNGLPQPLGKDFGKYAELACSKELNRIAKRARSAIDDRQKDYREAQSVVPQANMLIRQKDYSSMLGILKQKMHLGFLTAKYKKFDKISVEEQASTIRKSLSMTNWEAAESNLKKLFKDRNFLAPRQIKPFRDKVLRELEDSLYSTIDRVTRANVHQFLDEKVSTLENVDSLYTDSVFLPVYDVTFSTGTQAQLLKRKEELVAHLAKMKDNEFPAKAITLLYDEFMKSPRDNGVLKARAIVTHGKYYQGEDKKIKRRMAECDPWSAKWIVKPKQYRRVFALPITDKVKGRNQYLFRLNVRIPTKAKFPVYDVNIKLPKYVAARAAEKQWYQKITLNRKPLKNEGRFSITAPTAANKYECQITPVRMEKDKSNYLQVMFRHNSFRPIPINVMVQKPMIKKH